MQTTLVNLEELVRPDHTYRKLVKVFDFGALRGRLKKLDNGGQVGADGYGIETWFRCLVLQFMEDLSDREAEKFLAENLAAKWFCGFNLGEQTPSFTAFGKVRNRIGVKVLSELFEEVKCQIKAKGYMMEAFAFVDSSSLISKASLWAERDKLIAKGIENLNNTVVPDVAADKDARIGCKGKDKFWYGFKRFNSVDMQSGMIIKVAITPANLPDSQGLKHICPRGSIVYGDKAFSTKTAQRILRQKGCENATIKKNNMRGKNFDLDRHRTRWRMPFESVFSKQPKRTRYRGQLKNQFAGFMDAMAHNLKRLVKLEEIPGSLSFSI